MAAFGESVEVGLMILVGNIPSAPTAGRAARAHAPAWPVTRQYRDLTLGFKITLADGSSLTSRRVVIAAGIGFFRSKPAVFDAVPATAVSHCYEGRRVSEFAGVDRKEVPVAESTTIRHRSRV